MMRSHITGCSSTRLHLHRNDMGRTSDRIRDSSSLSTPTGQSDGPAPSSLIITSTSDIESHHLREEQGVSLHRLPRSRRMDVRIDDVGRPAWASHHPRWSRTTPLLRGAHFRRNIWWRCGVDQSENAPDEMQDPEAMNDMRRGSGSRFGDAS